MTDHYINKGCLWVRAIPYPYSAMLAICSDLDETPNKDVYLEIMRFLNTGEETSIGVGVGLEVGNTMYFDMPENQFSYWNTDDEGRECIRLLIKSGFIDCIHSFGDNAKDRSFAERAINELVSNRCFIKVWVDHAQAITNIGEDIMQGYGDVPGHPAYHTDLLCGYGIKYVWRGRVTSLIGQETKRSYKGIVDSSQMRSVLTLIKQVAKDIAGYINNKKYRIHGKNRLIREVTLRDGNRVTEFIRCNPYLGGVDKAATADGIADVLTTRYLDRLIKSGGTSILYTHLGKVSDIKTLFKTATRHAFLRLSNYSENKKILVATTYRLLEYCRMLDKISLTSKEGKEIREIHADFEGDESALQGLTIVSESNIPHILVVNSVKSIIMTESGRDTNGEWLYSVPWEKLHYPL